MFKNFDWRKWLSYIMDFVSGILKRGSRDVQNEEVTKKSKSAESKMQTKADEIVNKVRENQVKRRKDFDDLTKDEKIKALKKRLKNIRGGE